MPRKNSDRQVNVDGVEYTLFRRDYDLLYDILTRARILKNEKLTETRAKRLLADLYPNVLYYNHDTGMWNRRVYNGYDIEWQDVATKFSKDLKAVLERVPVFGNFYELVANIIITVDGDVFSGNGRWVDNVKYSPNGAGVLGNMIVRNKKYKNLELWNKSSWLGVDIYAGARDAVCCGAAGFAVDGASVARFQTALLAARNR